MTIMSAAAMIESVTIGWQVYQIGRQTMSEGESAFLVGLVGLVQFVPMFVLTLFAGSLADRISRRKIVIVAIAVEALGVVGLTIPAMQDQPSLTVIFVIAAVFGNR